MDNKMDKGLMNAMGGSPSSQAKKDVLLALKKMAMEMMSEGTGEDHPAGIMAKLDVKKVTPGMEVMTGDDMGDVDTAEEEGSESVDDKIAELEAQLQELKAKKQA